MLNLLETITKQKWARKRECYMGISLRANWTKSARACGSYLLYRRHIRVSRLLLLLFMAIGKQFLHRFFSSFDPLFLLSILALYWIIDNIELWEEPFFSMTLMAILHITLKISIGAPSKLHFLIAKQSAIQTKASESKNAQKMRFDRTNNMYFLRALPRSAAFFFAQNLFAFIWKYLKHQQWMNRQVFPTVTTHWRGEAAAHGILTMSSRCEPPRHHCPLFQATILSHIRKCAVFAIAHYPSNVIRPSGFIDFDRCLSMLLWWLNRTPVRHQSRFPGANSHSAFNEIAEIRLEWVAEANIKCWSSILSYALLPFASKMYWFSFALDAFNEASNTQITSEP